MPAPFYNAIKGTSSGSAGTGAFTPAAAATGFRAWSTVPTGWIGLVRYDDGSAWELCYSYWNGTTLSRASTQVYDSSSGSQLTLTSSATASLIIDAGEVMSHLGTNPWRGYFGIQSVTTVPTTVGMPAVTVTGTATAASIATTNSLTEQPRSMAASATTANAQAGYSSTGIGVYSSTSGRGGIEFTSRWGADTLPAGPRLFVGMTSTTYVGSTAEPGVFSAHFAAFTKDSTDTNIQFTTNANAGTATKQDTGITLVANGLYETVVWVEPGTAKFWGLIIRLDTGAIWLGSATSNIPTSPVVVRMVVVGGLNGTNTGTAFNMNMLQMVVRGGI